MKKYLKDILYCIKFSIYIFLGAFLIGGLIGLIVKGANIIYIMTWGSRIAQYISFFGLFIAAISFMNENSMRPLNYEENWKSYFSKVKPNFCYIFYLFIYFNFFNSMSRYNMVFY